MTTRVLITVFGIALLVGAAGAAPVARAAGVLQQDSQQLQQSAAANANDSSLQNSLVSGSGTGSGSVSSAPASGAADPSAQKTQQQLPSGNPANDTSYDGIMSRIMGLFAWLLGVAAITLDNAMYYTVVQMGSIVGGTNGLAAIGTAWRILRDLGNIVLIFGFVAIGVSIILDRNWYGGGTKMLPTLLMAAVFLNFSLFISEAVIDVGNLFATEFYTQINGGSAAKPIDYSNTNIVNEGISNKIMSQLGLQALYGDAIVNKDIFKAGNSWFLGFMGILLFMIAAFVMFTLAFILIARFVVLVFLIIVAPIGFAGLAVPQLKGTADSWWSTLFEQTVTAPVLLLMLYVALAVITDAKFLTNFGVGGSNSAASNTTAGVWTSWLQGSTGVNGLASAVLSFLVAMGLLLMVTILSKKLAAFGGSWASNLGSKLTVGLAASSYSFLNRNTVGWAATSANRRFRNTRLARVPIIGRGIANRLEAASKATYDVRNTGAVKSLGGALGKLNTGLSFGEGAKTGYAQQEAEAIKAREAYAKSLGQTKQEKSKQETEEARAKLTENQLKDLEIQNREERADLQTKQRTELRSFEDELKESRKRFAQADAARKAGHITKAQADAIAQAKAELDAAQSDYDAKRAQQIQERVDQQKYHDQLVAVQEEEIRERKKQVHELKTKPQATYAKGLLLGLDKDNPINTFIFGNPNRNTQAAKNILDSVKDKDAKKVDDLATLLKKAAGKK